MAEDGENSQLNAELLVLNSIPNDSRSSLAISKTTAPASGGCAKLCALENIRAVGLSLLTAGLAILSAASWVKGTSAISSSGFFKTPLTGWGQLRVQGATVGFGLVCVLIIISRWQNLDCGKEGCCICWIPAVGFGLWIGNNAGIALNHQDTSFVTPDNTFWDQWLFTRIAFAMMPFIFLCLYFCPC